MIEEERDFEALWHIACAENEELRKKLGGSWLRFRLKMPDAYEVMHFIEKHYLFCIFLLFLVSAVIGGVYRIYEDRRST